jgi:hypothetical protein
MNEQKYNITIRNWVEDLSERGKITFIRKEIEEHFPANLIFILKTANIFFNTVFLYCSRKTTPFKYDKKGCLNKFFRVLFAVLKFCLSLQHDRSFFL